MSALWSWYNSFVIQPEVDAGTYDNVSLHSRDEQSVLVVSYADLKSCLEKTFSELLSASSEQSANHGSVMEANSGRGTCGSVPR